MTTTYQRIQELKNASSVEPNMLKDLHDCIYQWAETIPTGGAKTDISNNLQDIYQTHSARISQKKAAAEAAAAQRQPEPTQEPQAALDEQEETQEQPATDGVSLAGTPYDPASILDFDSDADEDAYYDEEF